MRQGVQPQLHAQYPSAHSHRRQAVHVWSVWERISPGIWTINTHSGCVFLSSPPCVCRSFQNAPRLSLCASCSPSVVADAATTLWPARKGPARNVWAHVFSTSPFSLRFFLLFSVPRRKATTKITNWRTARTRRTSAIFATRPSTRSTTSPSTCTRTVSRSRTCVT